MASTYQIVYTDDIDGTPNAERLTFAFDGKEYTLDLSKRNRTKLTKALQPFVDAAERAPHTVARKNKTASSGEGGQYAQIREWAKQHKIEVPQRGRMPKAIIEQYDNYQKNVQHVG